MKTDDYISQLKGFSMANSSLDENLNSLEKNNIAFENLQKHSSKIGKDHLHNLEEFASLVKIKNLASEISSKKSITSRLLELNSSVDLLSKRNIDSDSLKAAIYSVFHDKENGVHFIIDELNSFKSKLNELENHHSKIYKSLDDKTTVHGLSKEHIEHLHSVHASQKKALKGIIANFISVSRKNIVRLKNNKK